MRLKLTGFCLISFWVCSGCGRSLPEVVGPCNGSEELCDRPYDRVTFATTHNSMSNQDDDWVYPNQQHGIERQLRDGIRGFMLDLHYWEDEVMLCHGLCAFGSTLFGMKPLDTALAEMKRFIDENPGEVLTIIFESYVDAADAMEVFDAAGLSGRAYSHARGRSWPTLRKLLVSGKNLVVFTDDEDGSSGWYQPVWEHCWETDYDIQSIEEFDCEVNRGARDNDLFILNHFIGNPNPSEEEAAEINVFDFLYPRATQCFEETGMMPNFVAVDFYATGDIVEVVEQLNR